MWPRPDLGERQSQILASLVYEYIATGLPVGSRTLARHYGLGVSPATIRNTMSELEELGLVLQPHTSAGRVPTDLGIRIFVDALMEVRDLTDEERQRIAARAGGVGVRPDRWEETGRVLSELSQHAAIVLTPRPDSLVLAQIRFVPLASGEVLALLVGESGIVLHRPFVPKEEPGRRQLERIHNYLNELVPGKTLSQARAAIDVEMDEARQTLDALRTQALNLGRDALAGAGDDAGIVVQGQARLVAGRAAGDLEQMRHVMALLEDQSALSHLLDATMAADGAQVVIGDEHPATGGAAVSVVAAPYRHAAGALGSVAVVGPKSMDYCRVLPIVEFTALVISDGWTAREAEPAEEPGPEPADRSA